MKSTESKTDLILLQTEQYLKYNLNLSNKKIRILIALSSGPDSTALLDVLWKLSDQYNLELVCACYNHGMRDEDILQKEIDTAEKNCLFRDVEFVIGKDTGLISREIKELGAEGAARKYRYIFLNSVFEEKKCDYMAMGHNLDDQVETVVMRLFSGSGSTGLKGIPKINGNIIRPLISSSKKDILKYLEKYCIKYSVDQSNNNDIYLRNRIRNKLLPEAAAIFPGLEKSLVSLSEKMGMSEAYIKKEAEKNIKWVPVEEGYKTDFSCFFSQPDILRLESLYSVINRIYISENKRIPYSFLKTLINDDSVLKKSSTFLEGYGLTFFRTKNELFLVETPMKTLEKNAPVVIENKKSIYPIYKNRYICIEEKYASECSDKDLWINPDCVKGKLYIRYREEEFLQFSVPHQVTGTE
jgi:tRNA(Ile)-lysidine synthase